MAVRFKDLRLLDTFTAENFEYLNKTDLDLGSDNAVSFPFDQWTLVASVGKESVITLLDAANLGGTTHHQALYTSPRWGNHEALLHDRGTWGAMATWQDAQGRRYLAASMLGPVSKTAPAFKYTNGPSNGGSMMVWEVRRDQAAGKPVLVPLWISRELHAPDVPVVANGVLYTYQSGKDSTETRSAGAGRGAGGGAGAGAGAGRGTGAGGGAAAAGAGGAGRGAAGGGPQRATANAPSRATNAFRYAFDAETGKQLAATELDSFNHFVNPVVAGGVVYASSWDGKLHAFGLKK